jgi:ubiquinone/menaquinone biosynthesis C-methylase UbiE
MSRQSRTFLDGEGDEWYSRNRFTIDDPAYVSSDVTLIIRTLGGSPFPIQNVLEIGCSSASKLAALSSGLEAKGVGVDPSNQAIQEAKIRYADLDLHVGIASALPFLSKEFDLVFFGFCLYLVPPEELEKSILESLRVCRTNGFIAITDFDPGVESVVPYRHVQGLQSYKRNYFEILKQYCDITLVSKISFSHASDYFAADKNERISTQIFFIE